jgi:hypothetical protein
MKKVMFILIAFFAITVIGCQKEELPEKSTDTITEENTGGTDNGGNTGDNTGVVYEKTKLYIGFSNHSIVGNDHTGKVIVKVDGVDIVIDEAHAQYDLSVAGIYQISLNNNLKKGSKVDIIFTGGLISNGTDIPNYEAKNLWKEHHNFNRVYINDKDDEVFYGLIFTDTSTPRGDKTPANTTYTITIP